MEVSFITEWYQFWYQPRMESDTDYELETEGSNNEGAQQQQQENHLLLRHHFNPHTDSMCPILNREKMYTHNTYIHIFKPTCKHTYIQCCKLP